jgi:hypothetical protein
MSMPEPKKVFHDVEPKEFRVDSSADEASWNNQDIRTANTKAATEGQEDLLQGLLIDYMVRREAGEQPDLEEYTSRYPDIEAQFKSGVILYELKGRDLLGELRTDRMSPGYAERVRATAADPQHQAHKQRVFATIFGQASQSEEGLLRGTDADEADVQKPGSSVATNADDVTEGEDEDRGDSDHHKPRTGGPRRLQALPSLLQRIRKAGKRPDRLAEENNAALDLYDALDRGLVKVPGLARKLVLDLVRSIGGSESEVLDCVRRPPLSAAVHYNENVPHAPEKQDFATWVRQSLQLTEKQKEYWLNEIARDAYTEAEA